MRTKSLLSLGVAALALSAPASALAVEYGPAPTAASVTATTGPFAVTKTALTDGQTPSDFAAANVWYPTPSQNVGKTFGAIAIAPGFTETESQIAWLGPRLASQGFVVVTFNTNSLVEAPSSRGIALLTAAHWLASGSPAKDEVDPDRLAVMGHSMGGGGVLDAVQADSSIKAAVALMPYEQYDKNFSTVTTPTMIVGGTADIIAPTNSFASPMYASIPNTTSKSYLVLANATHWASTSPNPWIAASSIQWLKRFLDGDTRYSAGLKTTVPLGVNPGSVNRYTGTFGTW